MYEVQEFTSIYVSSLLSPPHSSIANHKSVIADKSNFSLDALVHLNVIYVARNIRTNSLQTTRQVLYTGFRGSPKFTKSCHSYADQCIF